MAEVAYSNFQHQGYRNQALGALQHFGNQAMSGNGYNHPMTARYNPYQRPSPPIQQARTRQSPPLVQYKAAQMVARHQSHQHQMLGWTHNAGMKHPNEDFNANSQAAPIHNGHWGNGSWAQHGRPVTAASPPLEHQNYAPSTSPMLQGLPSMQEQAMRRRMSSSSQSSEYSVTSGVQGYGNGNRWLVSPGSTTNVTNGQYNQQHSGGYPPSEISPNPGAVPNWSSNPVLPYSTPSPMSSVSSENTSPPHALQFLQQQQQQQFRPPPVAPHLGTQMGPPQQVPIVPTEIPPGTTTGTSGNDWEVDCLGAKVKLRNSELWKHFENVVMEMVISKHGRRMFPVLEYDVKGLHPHKLYSVFVDFVLANKYVWKFSEQKWNPSGLAPEEDIYDQSHRVCLHPESPAPGEVWNKRGVSFSKMKLSNHLHTDSDKLSLKSLHKYQPRLHVVEVDPRDPSVQTNLRTFIIPKTQFMTVTLYHNTDVAQLKINLNPFARCFRDKEISPTTKSIEDTPSPANKADDYSVDDIVPSWKPARDATVSGNLNEPHTILKIENPVPQADLQRAKEFMQQQLNTMTRLVKAQDALATSQRPAVNSPTLATIKNGEVETVDFDRELEGLLGNFTEDKHSDLGSKADDKKKTVHHFAPNSNASEVKPPSAKRSKVSDQNPLVKYELLNVDRCFPPNAIAPLSNTLPFDPAEFKSKSASSGLALPKLPTFFKCSYYQEQAARAARTSSERDARSNLPVVYVPKAPANDNQEDASEFLATMSQNPAPSIPYESPKQVEPDDETTAEQEISLPPNRFTTSPDNGTNIDEDGDKTQTIGKSRFGTHTTDAADLEITSPSASSVESVVPYNNYAIPTLSPKSIQQFLDSDINEMMSGNTRKCSFVEDIDDDVFSGADEASLMKACGIFNPQSRPFLPNITS